MYITVDTHRQVKIILLHTLLCTNSTICRMMVETIEQSSH